MTGWRFLFLSLAVHLLIWLWLLNRPPYVLPNPNKTVEVTINESQPRETVRNKRVVRQALPSLDLLKPQAADNARFLSERDQAVKKEMQAKTPGLTQNRPETRAKLGGESHQGAKGSKQEVAQDSDVPGPKQTRKQSQGEGDNLRGLGRRLLSETSTSGEYLPDVEEGPITALNTERFIYYTFFARIEERIRPLWERNVQDAAMRLTPGQQREIQNHDWVTGLEIILDSHGDYLTTVIQKSSGINVIDHSASEAFREAAYFPNPPKGMIQADGRIHLKYAFIVQHSASQWARQSSY